MHIYDKFNRCILSNEKKADIEAKTYTIQDYKRIESIINSNNKVNYGLEKEIPLDIINIELAKLNELIEKCPKMSIMEFIRDYLDKIKDSVNQIFNFKNNTDTAKTKINPKDVFNIYRHISMLNSQIDTEINELIVKITVTDKNINKYSKILTNLGYYNKQCEEYNNNLGDLDTDININNSNLYKYTKKEEHINHTIKLLNDIISHIKNGELSNPLNKENIRPQYRTFLQFGENIKLFKMLSINTRTIFNYSNLIKSKHKYKIFSPEMVSSILRYLNVISLVNLFNELETNTFEKNKTIIDSKGGLDRGGMDRGGLDRGGMDRERVVRGNKLGNQMGDLIDYEFRQNIDPDESLRDLNEYMNLGIENDDEDEVLIDSININQKNTNLKIISEFIINYLDKINDIQITYDELTNSNIKLLVITHDQKVRNANLRSFEWLSNTGNEAEREYIYLKMHKLQKLKYADLSNYLAKNYDVANKLNLDIDDEIDIDDVDNINNTDGNDGNDYEDKIDYDVEYNEDGNEKREMDIDNDEMGYVFDAEDNDDGDQDYGYLAVDDGDYD